MERLHGWSTCENCGNRVHESYPHCYENGTLYCLDCSFVLGKLSEKDYLKHFGSLNNMHAAVNPEGKPVVWTGKSTPPWERSSREERSSKKYEDWRWKVFERDNYTCQDCGQRGGKLNAHHIKSFKDYKKLRYKISNGLTLCEKCHRLRHGKGGVGGKTSKRGG